MWTFLFETTLKQLGQATSGLIQKHKDIRSEHNSTIKFSRAYINSEKNYLQMEFLADSTFGGVSNAPRKKRLPNQLPTQYTLALRFKGVNAFFPRNWKRTNIKNRVDVLKNIVANCDIRFYSSGSDFFYQGAWEELDKRDLSIYQFPGPRGKMIWKDRHEASGGISPGIYLTKHLSQLVDELDTFFLPQVAKSLTTRGGVAATKPTEVPKKRGRPPKQKYVEPVEEEPDDNEDVLAAEETQDRIRYFHQEDDPIAYGEVDAVDEELSDDEKGLADWDMQEKIRWFRRQEESFLRSIRRLFS